MSEIRWLIERGQAQHQDPPIWWAGGQVMGEWTSDVNLAVGFCRKSDAEIVGTMMPQLGRIDLAWAAVEHMWLDKGRDVGLAGKDKEIADLRAENEQLKAERKLSVDREWLGKLVRLQWVKWAETQADAKSDWLVPWEQLEERYREVDRQIGEFIASQCVSPELLKVESERDQLRAQISEAEKRGMEKAFKIADMHCGNTAKAIRAEMEKKP